MIQAQVEGIGTLEFPDGTDPSVVQKTVKRIVSQHATAPDKSTSTTPYSQFLSEQRQAKEPEQQKAAAKAEAKAAGQARLKQAEAKVEANPVSTPLSTALDFAGKLATPPDEGQRKAFEMLPDVAKKGLRAARDTAVDLVKATYDPTEMKKATAHPLTGQVWDDVGEMGVAGAIDFTKSFLGTVFLPFSIAIESPIAALQAMNVISPRTSEQIHNTLNGMLGAYASGVRTGPVVGPALKKIAGSLKAADALVGDAKVPDPRMDIPAFEKYRAEAPRNAAVIEELHTFEKQHPKEEPWATYKWVDEEPIPAAPVTTEPIAKKYGAERVSERQQQATARRQESEMGLSVESWLVKQSDVGLATLNRDVTNGTTTLNPRLVPASHELMQKQVNGEPISGEDLIHADPRCGERSEKP